MRITNQNQPPIASTDNKTDPAASARRNDAAASASSPSSPPPSVPVSLVPSFELFSLTSTLQHIPPLRQEVIAETIRRLAAGQLQSPAALEQTARAILGM